MKFVALVGLVAGLWCYHLASGVTHKLEYFYTATSGIPNFPEFVDVGVVDGVPISRYDSNTQRKVPLQKWMEENFDQHYWDQSSAMLKGAEQNFKANIQIVKERFNQTGGVHTFQWLYSCEWDDDTEAIAGHEQFGYDGQDFILLDLKNLRWIAPVPQSEISKRKWDNDRAQLDYKKNYFAKECIDWLKKYVQFGRSTLERTVSPEVSLLQKESSQPQVVCLATGFYPNGVMITWKRDGEEMQEDVDVGETLPNEDGTFQKRAVLTMTPEERKKSQYTCEVAHKSGKPIVKTLIVEDGTTVGIIVGCVVAALVVIGGVVGFVVMKIRKKDYKEAGQSDTDSDNSNPNARK